MIVIVKLQDSRLAVFSPMTRSRVGAVPAETCILGWRVRGGEVLRGFPFKVVLMRNGETNLEQRDHSSGASLLHFNLACSAVSARGDDIPPPEGAKKRGNIGPTSSTDSMTTGSAEASISTDGTINIFSSLHGGTVGFGYQEPQFLRPLSAFPGPNRLSSLRSFLLPV
jgi:hypothetical protein